jgi:hypothetical protein
MAASSMGAVVATGIAASAFTPGKAYWNQRHVLASSRQRLLALGQAVGRLSDLSLYQYAQFFAATMEFAPDLVLELGRHMGNSTCVFTEAVNQLPDSSSRRVVSLCKSSHWEIITKPKVQRLVPSAWFSPLQALRADILKFDFSETVAGARRVLLFWDAHGFDIAECVLGSILPLLKDKPHIVLMHDMSDMRYVPANLSEYGERGLWKGETAAGERLRIGIVDSAVPQSIAMLDFSSRNRITWDSADHSFDLELNPVPGRVAEMRSLLGDDFFALQGHWFWFTLNEHEGPFTFPRVRPARRRAGRVFGSTPGRISRKRIVRLAGSLMGIWSSRRRDSSSNSRQ